MTHQEKKPFSERHPKLNLLVNLIVVIISLAVVAMVVYYFWVNHFSCVI